METILRYQNRINSVQQNICNLNQNDHQSLAIIVINMGQIFSEVKDNNALSENILPRLELTMLALESKTQKSFENIFSDLNAIYEYHD